MPFFSQAFLIDIDDNDAWIDGVSFGQHYPRVVGKIFQSREKTP